MFKWRLVGLLTVVFLLIGNVALLRKFKKFSPECQEMKLSLLKTPQAVLWTLEDSIFGEVV